MKRIILFSFYTVCLLRLSAQIQDKQFPIGMFGSHFMMQDTNGCYIPFNAPKNDLGFNTSTLNILAEDGFNLLQIYDPNEWTSIEIIKQKILLTGANGMKIELGGGHFFRPSLLNMNEFPVSGENIYNNCGLRTPNCNFPAMQGLFRANIDQFIHEIYTKQPYSEIIWGYHIAEEASIFHPFQHTEDCRGSEWKNESYFAWSEIPPRNVKRAIQHYLESLDRIGINNHKTIIMEAHHHKAILENSADDFGVYNPQEYLYILDKNDPRQIYFEGSYTQFPYDRWENQHYKHIESNNYHYLAPFKSIDFAKKHAHEVHKVINIEGTTVGSNYWAHFHTNPEIPNANWLWFQIYTSIIHGADGIWFWDLIYCWNTEETNNWGERKNHKRYEREFFPGNYKNFVAYLAREIRLLDAFRILTPSEKTTLAQKTDYKDQLGIVPPARTYISRSFPREKRREAYGLRYVIKTNGYEAYMIISNPFNGVITTELDFTDFSHPLVQKANKVQFLFESNRYKPDEKEYKLDRDNLINLEKNTTGLSYKVPFNDKKLPLTMGPLDVKIIKFVSSTREE